MKSAVLAMAVTVVLAGCGSVEITATPNAQVCASLEKAQKDLQNVADAAKGDVKGAKQQLKAVEKDLQAGSEQDSENLLTDALTAQLDAALGSIKEAATPEQLQSSIESASGTLDALVAAAGCN